MTIGEKIKSLRQAKKLSQRAMAKDLNITNPTISMWENGIRNPDTHTLTELSKYFNVPISYFFEDQKNDLNKPIEIMPYHQEVIDLVLQLDLIQCSRLCGYIEHQFETTLQKTKESK